jgi:hypothetical protein
MTANSPKRLFEQILLAMGFLGAIAFAGLVLVLQAPHNFQTSVGGMSKETYFTLLITLLGLISFFSIFGSLALAFTAGGVKDTRMAYFATTMVGLTLAFLVFAVPMLIAPTNLIAALIVGLLGATICFLYIFIVLTSK